MEDFYLEDLCEDCLTLPGHDNAILGIVSQTMSKHVLYHVPKIIENLVNEGMDPEEALERTNQKFKKRFEFIEARAKELGKEMGKMSLEEMNAIWNEPKRS